MKTLSISKAWDESAAFVKREGTLLFPVAFALIALPGILFQAMVPAPTPGESPEPGLWPLFFLPMLFATLLGTLSLTVMALRPGTIVKDAIAAAARRVLPVFGAILVFGLGVALIAVPAALALTNLAAGGSRGTAAFALGITIPIIIYLGTRFLLINPVGTIEPVGPIAMLKRSWQLTAGHFWKLFGFMMVLAIVVAIIGIAVSAIGGLLVLMIAGKPDPGSLSALLVLIIGGLLNAVVSVYATAATARIYAQLG